MIWQSLWWKGAVAVAVGPLFLTGDGERALELSPFYFHGDLRATIPRKIAITYFCVQQFLLRCSPHSGHHYLTVGQVVVHHFLIFQTGHLPPAMRWLRSPPYISLLFYAYITQRVPRSTFAVSERPWNCPSPTFVHSLSKAHKATAGRSDSHSRWRLANPDASSKIE